MNSLMTYLGQIIYFIGCIMTSFLCGYKLSPLLYNSWETLFLDVFINISIKKGILDATFSF